MSNDKRFSLSDIAARAGVSITTVSRALDPLRADLLKPATRGKILALCRKLHFASNQHARRLKRGKSETISLVIPANVFQPPLHADFSAKNGLLLWQMVEGILREARRWNYDVKLEPLFERNASADVLARMAYPHSAGTIVMGGYEQEGLMTACRQRKIPFLVTNTYDAGQFAYPEVCADTRKGIAEAMRHLLDRGHRKVAFFHPIGGLQYINGRIRLQVYRSMLTDAGLFRKEWIFAFSNERAIRKHLQAYRKQFPFTAVVCMNDAMAIAVARELEDEGVGAPKPMAVIGFDNNPVFAREPQRLSTIDVPRRELGEVAVRMFVQMVENKEPLPGKRILPTSFLCRDTG